MTANVAQISEREERLLSALAHGSIVGQGLGILVGVLLYVTQRERSARVAFQALQAAVYQLLGLLVIMTLWVLWGVMYGVSMVPLMVDPAAFESDPPAFFFISMAAMVIPFALMVVWGLYGLLGAVQTLRGRDFRYLLIGGLLNGVAGNDKS